MLRYWHSLSTESNVDRLRWYIFKGVGSWMSWMRFQVKPRIKALSSDSSSWPSGRVPTFIANRGNLKVTVQWVFVAHIFDTVLMDHVSEGIFQVLKTRLSIKTRQWRWQRKLLVHDNAASILHWMPNSSQFHSISRLMPHCGTFPNMVWGWHPHSCERRSRSVDLTPLGLTPPLPNTAT